MAAFPGESLRGAAWQSLVLGKMTKWTLSTVRMDQDHRQVKAFMVVDKHPTCPRKITLDHVRTH